MLPQKYDAEVKLNTEMQSKIAQQEGEILRLQRQSSINDFVVASVHSVSLRPDHIHVFTKKHANVCASLLATTVYEVLVSVLPDDVEKISWSHGTRSSQAFSRQRKANLANFLHKEFSKAYFDDRPSMFEQATRHMLTHAATWVFPPDVTSWSNIDRIEERVLSEIPRLVRSLQVAVARTQETT